MKKTFVPALLLAAAGLTACGDEAITSQIATEENQQAALQVNDENPVILRVDFKLANQLPDVVPEGAVYGYGVQFDANGSGVVDAGDIALSVVMAGAETGFNTFVQALSHLNELTSVKRLVELRVAALTLAMITFLMPLLATRSTIRAVMRFSMMRLVIFTA
ncbi:hypothetical protein [Photobacterium galatheae]|uniref:EF-hand domain-containing protein n=1 Tax=Photobacterium galatheae TaxID=1654360 RepID=A0A066RUW2_9GAMM|nr:hypothetical protein [Photobacterium galatheae]KDM91502.1 hypothetical protein EA58_10780 [Photobacterium galatheae]MCM0149576.1 hypothetical protein [Photobacterium galatheae]